MGEWMKENPVLSGLINFALVILLTLFFCKIYIDYKTNEEMGQLKRQLNQIESATDTIITIIQDERED